MVEKTGFSPGAIADSSFETSEGPSNAPVAPFKMARLGEGTGGIALVAARGSGDLVAHVEPRRRPGAASNGTVDTEARQALLRASLARLTAQKLRV